MRIKMWNSIKQLVNICKKQKGPYLIAIILSILSVLCKILVYYGIYLVMDRAIHGNHDIFRYLILVATGFAGEYLFFSLASVRSHHATANLLAELRNQITSKMAKLSLGDLRSYTNGYYKKLLVEDVESLEKFLAHNVPEVSSGIGVSILLILLFLLIDWRLGIAAIINIPISYKVLSGMMKGAEEKVENYASSLEQMNASIIEYIHGMNVIKAYHRTDDKLNRLEGAVSQFRFYVIDWYRSCWKYLSGYAVLLRANLLILIPAAGTLFLMESCEISTILFFLMMSFSFTVPLTKLGEFTDTMPMLSETWNQIEDYLNKTEMQDAAQNVQLSDYSILFENVSFHYVEGIPAVKGLSFIAPQGEITALVGESGSGKSTTAKLAARFWDAASGQIYIGGIPISEIPICQLMDNMSFVFQNGCLFHDTIENNIRIGKPDATSEELYRAIKLASCKNIIDEKGLNAVIGGKGGIQLSGGECQRITLARAILKNAPILILDEATASSDAENQWEVQKAISALAKDKTVITIAHRLSSIVDARQILVFSAGEIAEQGTHQELIEKRGIYNRLYRSYLEGQSFRLETR